MNFGSTLLLFGLDLDLIQGIVNDLYQKNPDFQTYEPADSSLRLQLDQPLIETRDDENFRMGLHLTGQLFIGDGVDPLVFDTWVRLKPEVVIDNELPVGALRFDAVEDVLPVFAEQQVIDAFSPEGFIGSVLEDLAIPVFENLLNSVSSTLFPGVSLDIDLFETAFYLGKSASISRPLWNVGKEEGEWQPVLQFDVSYATKPALIASVALSGQDPIPPETPSIVRPGTGLGLVTTAAFFEARFAIEKLNTEGSEVSDLTIDEINMASTDYGIEVSGEGHKTGATVSFSGSLVGMFKGGIGGDFTMRSTIETDVDADWWVDLLSVVAMIVPAAGWILGDIFIWGPTAEAPDKVESALLEKFSTPLQSMASSVASGFNVEDIPTSTYLADVWFFDNNMSVAAAAFVGTQSTTVRSVTRDIAYLALDPAGRGKHTNKRRPVTSVAEIIVESGQALKPWQAGQLVRDELLDIIGHHSVANPLAKGGIYLRSNPDDTTSNNLLDD